jgi:hypothetical protein
MTSTNRRHRAPAAVAASVLLAAGAPPLHANAAGAPAADKVIALVQSSGCDLTQLRPEMAQVTKALVADRRTSRVVVDWPVDPERNLDVLGRPSPVIAALEVTAPPPDLAALADRVGHGFGGACKVAVYLVHGRTFVSTPRTWALGEATPGTKLFNMLVRKDGLSLGDFDAAWSGPHAKLALSWREAGHVTGGHYVQNLVVGRLGDAPALDGIGEGEGPHPASEQERAARMEAAQQTSAFVDMAKSTMFHAKEFVLKD